MGCRTDISLRSFLELEATVFESSNDLSFASGWDKDVIGEIRGEEEDGAISVRPRRRQPKLPSVTHIPARANGLVSSRTRLPASRPCPSTDMTTKSSGETLGPFRPAAEEASRGRVKSTSANAFGHTIEHSIGVIDTFKNGYRFTQGRLGSGRWSDSDPSSCRLTGKMRERSGCRKD